MTMRKMSKRFSSLAGVSVLLFSTTLLVNCSGGGSDHNPPAALAGNVVQGAVVGATVFADRTTSTIDASLNQNYKLDADEVVAQDLTGPNGEFSFAAAPGYVYVSVSIGGTDSITGKPAGQMLAPQGVTVVSPLTTMVALTPANQRQNVINTIANLGIAYDSNISTNITPAAAVFVASVQATLNSLAQTLAADGPLKTDQVSAVQRTALANIAANMNGQTAAALTDTPTLTNTLNASVTATLDTIVANNIVTMTVEEGSSTATMAQAITNNVVNTVATAVGSTSTSGAVAENTLITPAEATTINGVVNTAVDTAQEQVTVTPPAPTPPTITNQSPATAVVAGSAYSYSPNATDTNTADTLTFTIVNKPAWATLDPATGVLAGTPSAAGTFSGIVITVSDGQSSASIGPFTINVTTPTGGTGGTGNGG
jgi:hypothetical protein